MLNLSSTNFLRILIFIIGLISIITMANSKNHQTSLHYKRNHQSNDLRHPVASKNRRKIYRRKRFDFIATAEPVFYNKSLNIHSMNISTSTERLINDILREKMSKTNLFNVQVRKNNDNSLDELEKLFGIIQNKSRVSKLTLNNPITPYIQMKRNDSKFNKPLPLSPASCEYLRNLEESFAAKVVAFKKLQWEINRQNEIDSRKRLKRDVNNEIDGDDINEKVEIRPIRNADNNLSSKIQLDDIYPDTVVNVEDQLPLVKLIRTKRFGDAGHESQVEEKNVKMDKNINESTAQRRYSRNARKSSQDSKALELLQDLQNLAQNIVAKIAEVQGSMKLVTRLGRYSQGSSSLIKSPKSANQVSSDVDVYKYKIAFDKS